MPDTRRYHLHLISDSTGETLHALARAALAPFGDTELVEIHLAVFVRSDRDLAAALDEVRTRPGLVWYTAVDPELGRRIAAGCAEAGVPATSILAPLIDELARFTGEAPGQRPGGQHRMTDGYFDRIAALDYAVSHDDGALGARLRRADVILTGISRTSKTPTCIYLAYRGVKAANVPLVPGREPPAALFEALEAGVPVVGLTASPARLAQVRSHRLESLGQPGTAEYADLDRIRAEVADARLFFQRHHLPVIDVTRRSIEETAAEILAVLRARGAVTLRAEGPSGSGVGP
jgi:regulator of PEP synthase PpsR (kinase-PPPase family)